MSTLDTTNAACAAMLYAVAKGNMDRVKEFYKDPVSIDGLVKKA